MQTIAEYFNRQDTPAANSPVGRLMRVVIAKFPGIAFDNARVKASELLDRAAGKRIYKIPPVLTDAESQARRDAVRARFAGMPQSRAA